MVIGELGKGSTPWSLVWNRFIPHESQVSIYRNQGVVDSYNLLFSVPWHEWVKTNNLKYSWASQNTTYMELILTSGPCLPRSPVGPGGPTSPCRESSNKYWFTSLIWKQIIHNMHIFLLLSWQLLTLHAHQNWPCHMDDYYWEQCTCTASSYLNDFTQFIYQHAIFQVQRGSYNKLESRYSNHREGQ